MEKIVVVIPAYEPDEKLIDVLQQIRQQTDYPIIVVDDGSGEAYAHIFCRLEQSAIVLHHSMNRGKGAAIKTALAYIWDQQPEADAVVTIDADGQHKVSDMLRICEQVKEQPEALVLGSRSFDGKIPLRSRFGNTITKYVFRFAAGQFVGDTQTGLRGFSRQQIPFMLQIPGERYEYEMNVLMAWAKQKRGIVEVPIQTIYLEENQSSHFRAVKDSVIIYKEILKFSCASLLSFCVDFILFGILSALTAGMDISIVFSNIGARAVSSVFNFYLNKKYVFESNGTLWKEAVKYFMLAVFILTVNTELLQLLYTHVIPSKMAAKVITEVTLFLVSMAVQKLFVFRNKKA